MLPSSTTTTAGCQRSLRLNLAQFRELEAFAAFGSDLDKASKAALERGSRLVELLKQPQYTPFSMEREVVSVWAGTSGGLDDVPRFVIKLGRGHPEVEEDEVRCEAPDGVEGGVRRIAGDLIEDGGAGGR